MKALNSTAALLATGLLTVVLCASLTGCSGSDSPSGPGVVTASGGTGSMTLRVVAQAEGKDLDGGGFETDFLVTVTDELDVPVSGATVSVSGSFGTVVLTEDRGSAGDYTALRPDYTPGLYTLSVVRGTDNVDDVRVIAPVVHSITSPQPQDFLAKDQAFNVTWSRTSRAQESRVETRDYESAWMMSDTGTFTVPATGNPPRADQRVRVKRANRQAPDGGLPGSDFRARIRVTIEPVVSQ